MTYSNVAVSLAALAVERVAHKGFADVSVQRIFVPLGMTTTTWTAPSAASASVARPHVYEDGGFVARPHNSHALYPVVDLRSSARDLARYTRAILGGGALDGVRILSAASVDIMLRQALAWQLREIGNAHLAGHEGEDIGTTSALFVDTTAGTGVVVLANGDAFGSGNDERAKAIKNLIGDLLSVARPR